MTRYTVTLDEDSMHARREVVVEAKAIAWESNRNVVIFFTDNQPVAFFKITEVISVIADGTTPA